MRLAYRLAILLVVAPLAACFIMSPVEKPTATVRSASLGTASLTSLEGRLDLDVMNPNAFGVPLAGIDWELSIGGARAVSGHVELSQTIPARGVAPVTTSLTIDARDAVAVGAELARGARAYRLEARLHFTTPVGPIDVTVEHQGQLADAGGLLGNL